MSSSTTASRFRGRTQCGSIPAATAGSHARSTALGTIEVGRLADLAVLNADVFDAKAVSDDAIRGVHSVLTVLGGRIVHGDAAALR